MASANVYPNFFMRCFGSDIPDLESAGNLECMLLDAGHSFDTSDDNVADISINEIGDVDYDRQVVTGVIVSRTLGVVNIDCNNISFGAEVTISAHHAVIYVVGGTDSTSYLMFHVNFEGEESSTAGAFELQIHSDGLIDVIT